MKSKQLAISTLSAIVKIAALIFILTVVMKYATKAYDFGYRIFTEPPVAEGEGIYYTVTIQDGVGAKSIAEQLEEFGLIRDKNLFYVQYMLSDYKDKLQPGTYKLSTAMTAENMMQIMAKDAPAEAETEAVPVDNYGDAPYEGEDGESQETIVEEAPEE